VNPIWVARCIARLSAARTAEIRATHVCTVAGFPLGASNTAVKAEEARIAVEHGAAEVDTVANLGALIGGDRSTVIGDLAAVVDAVKRVNERAVVKVILETAALTDSQIILGCRCVAEAQADFVKTSTGFHPRGGATVEHVAILKRYASPLKVKAAGGIRELATSLAMIQAGADRLGMSASVDIMKMLPE
jgi:deoxyribose-phosphate aldolase